MGTTHGPLRIQCGLHEAIDLINRGFLGRRSSLFKPFVDSSSIMTSIWSSRITRPTLKARNRLTGPTWIRSGGRACLFSTWRDGQIFFGSFDPGVQREDLEGGAGAYSAEIRKEEDYGDSRFVPDYQLDQVGLHHLDRCTGIGLHLNSTSMPYAATRRKWLIWAFGVSMGQHRSAAKDNMW